MAKKKEITLDVLSEQIANLAKHTDYQIDDLAAMTMRGFSDMQDQMDKRFGGMQSEMDKRFGGMQSEMNKRFAEVNHELQKQRAEISALRTELRTGLTDLSLRISSLEKMAKEDIAVLGDEIFVLKKRIEKLEKNYLELKNAH